MTTNILLADLHSHSVASGHAFNTLNELALAASARGIRVLGVTDHGPSMDGAPTSGYFEMVDRVPTDMHGVQILFGCEANILDTDGRIDLTEPWASRQRIVLAGLHERTPYPRSAFLRDNTAAIVGAIRQPSIHGISHPWRSIFPVDVDVVAEAACEHNTLLEVNLSLFRTILTRSHSPYDEEAVVQTRCMLRRVQDLGGGFLVNSDTHEVSELGADLALLLAVADLLEFSADAILNNDLDRLCAYLPALKL